MLLVACGGLLNCCTGLHRGVYTDNDQPLIMVSLEPVRYLVEAVAGDKFKVISMIPQGAIPETYDPVPQQMALMNKSTAYFRIGYIGFEQVWMRRLQEHSPNLAVFDLSKGVNLITENHGHGHQEGVEPHIWNSPINALVIARNAFQSLVSLDRANEHYYRVRYDSLCGRIHRLDSLIRDILDDEIGSGSFLIYHPALSYFARDYQLTQIPIEEEGKEPSPNRMKELISRCKADSVSVIFIQPEFDRRNAEIISSQTHTRVIPVNPLSYDWEKEMLNVARVLGNKTIKQEK